MLGFLWHIFFNHQEYEKRQKKEGGSSSAVEDKPIECGQESPVKGESLEKSPSPEEKSS